MATEHKNAPPDLEPGNPEPGRDERDVHTRLTGEATRRGAAGAPTSGLRGTGGGLGDALAGGELDTEKARTRPEQAGTGAVGTNPGSSVAGGALAREANGTRDGGNRHEGDAAKRADERD